MHRFLKFVKAHPNVGPYVFAALAAIAVGLPAYTSNQARVRDVERLVHEIEVVQAAQAADRRDVIYASCLQQRRQQLDDIASQKRHDRQWADLLAPRPRTPELERRVVAALKTVDKDTDAKVVRDCTPRGIAKYYENPPHVTATTP